MSTKIGIDGKPFDPAEAARKAISALRIYSERTDQQVEMNTSLNAIADRLATCDALEEKVKRQDRAHVALIAAAERLSSSFWAGSDSCDELISDLEDALARVKP